MRPELIIFDCDGVLVDTEVVSNQILVSNLAGYGLSLTLTEAMALFVGGSMQGVKKSAEELGAKLPSNWVEEIYDQTYAKLREGVEPVEGIELVLRTLQQAGLSFCVASNGSIEKMGITLGSTGLADFFEGAMFSAHELKVWKPDPGLFLAAAAQFSVAPAACMVVEDSHNGVLAASNAGMCCCAYTPEGPVTDFTALGASCFEQMLDLPAILGLGHNT